MHFVHAVLSFALSISNCCTRVHTAFILTFSSSCVWNVLFKLISPPGGAVSWGVSCISIGVLCCPAHCLPLVVPMYFGWIQHSCPQSYVLVLPRAHVDSGNCMTQVADLSRQSPKSQNVCFLFVGLFVLSTGLFRMTNVHSVICFFVFIILGSKATLHVSVKNTLFSFFLVFIWQQWRPLLVVMGREAQFHRPKCSLDPRQVKSFFSNDVAQPFCFV